MATTHPRLSVSADFRRSLASTKVRDVVPPRHVVYARCTDSIASVFKLLVDNKILSVPVLDNLTNKFVAFVDILDILVYVVDRLRLDDERVSMGPLLESWVTQIEFQGLNCHELFSKSKRNPWFGVSENETLHMLLNVMATHNIHRAAVTNANGEIISIASMSRIIAWLHEHQNEMGNLPLMTLKQLNLGFRVVESVEASQLALDAFVKIARHGISGVAVLDEVGQIIGNISADDFKDIGYDASMFTKIYRTCAQFIELREYGRAVPKLVCVSPDTSLKQTLEILTTRKIHRVYIVEEKGGVKMPVGIVSLGDILKLFVAVLNRT